MGVPGHLQRSALDGGATGHPFPPVMRALGRRLLLTVPTLFGVLVVAFLLLTVAPGDPVQEMVGERADSTTIARLRAELHLDDPLPAQFGHYFWGVVRGDLGPGMANNRTVSKITQALRRRWSFVRTHRSVVPSTSLH